MSIRLIAKELYQVRNEKESLAQQLNDALPENQEVLRELLRKKSLEVKRLQEMLDGAKEQPGYRKPR